MRSSLTHVVYYRKLLLYRRIKKMFHVYNRASSIMDIVRDLNVGYDFPYRKKGKGPFTRDVRMTHDVNWGCARIAFDDNTLNRDLSVAVDKVKTFDAVSGFIPTPRIMDRYDAINCGESFLGRTRRGSCGRGIVKYNPGDRVGYHDFYVQFIPRQSEFRLHVFQGKIIARQLKIFDPINKDHTVINHANGTAFFKTSRKVGLDENTLRSVKGYALLACEKTGLDFGAIDFIQGRDGSVYFLEINTAPGIKAEKTRLAYTQAFSNFIVNE